MAEWLSGVRNSRSGACGHRLLWELLYTQCRALELETSSTSINAVK